MPHAFIQQVEDDNSGSGQTVITTPAWGASLTAGNLLVAHVAYFGAAQRTVTLSGAGSPTWTEEAVVVSSGGGWLHSFYAPAIGGGATTALTATFSAGVDYPSIYCAEHSGLKSASPRLAFASQHDVNVGAPSPDACSSGLLGTLAAQPAAIIGFAYDENGSATPSAGTGFTALTGVWDFGGSTMTARPEHRRVTATDSVEATFTAGANSNHFVAAWAFEEASGASPQTISAAGNIPSAEAFGTTKVNLTLPSVGNIATAEAFGTAKLNQTIGPMTGIASAEAFGAAAITGAGGTQAIFPAGIASAEAFGANASLVRGGVAISGVGNIASAESFLSSPTGQTLEWAAVEGADGYRIKWGTSSGGPYTTGSADVGNVTTCNVSSLALTTGTTYFVVVVALSGSTEGTTSAEVRVVPGTAAIRLSATIAPAGIASAEAFGALNLASRQIVAPSGIAGAEAFGSAVVSVFGGPLTIAAVGGIASAEAFGPATLARGAVTLAGAGAIASAEAFGAPQLAAARVLSALGGIASAEAFGTPVLLGGATVAFGRPRRGSRLKALAPRIGRAPAITGKGFIG